MTNKKLGNDFEKELADLLYKQGFWVHLLSQNQDGQPADIIAVKNKRAYLIDCKVCSTRKGFDLSRIEENQRMAMTLWRNRLNGEGWFAVKFGENIYMITLSQLDNMGLGNLPEEIFQRFALTLNEWMAIDTYKNLRRERENHVEFVSYDGAYPNLCSGTLVLKINGKERKLSNCLSSGGSVSFDDRWLECVTSGAWSVFNLPEDLEPYKSEIEKCVNENVPWGCCGGCV